MRRVVGIVLLGGLLVACGADQDPVVDAASETTAASSTSTPAAAGDGSVIAGDDGATTVPDTAPAGGPSSEPAAPAPTDAPTSLPAADAGNAIPAAGRYTFHTTGTATSSGVLGPGSQSIDQETVTDIVALSADTIRQSSTSPEGSQTMDLRYEADRVALLVLDLAVQGQQLRFASAQGETFTPVPPAPGQAWSWQLVDDGGTLTLDFAGTTQPPEPITVAGSTIEAPVVDATLHLTGTFAGFPVDATIDVRTWIDPARATSVQTHQVSETSQPVQSHSDTTSVLTGFTPS